MLKQPNANTTLLEFFRQLRAACPILFGRIIDCQFTVADGTVKFFPHNLGRAWVGAIIVGNDRTGVTSAEVGAAYNAGSDPDRFAVRLTVADDCTIRVWCF